MKYRVNKGETLPLANGALLTEGMVAEIDPAVVGHNHWGGKLTAVAEEVPPGAAEAFVGRDKPAAEALKGQ